MPLTCTAFVLSPPPIAVTTTMPRLRIAANAADTTSSVTTPMVTIAWSAPTPQVSSSASACASSVVATAWVAPKVKRGGAA